MWCGTSARASSPNVEAPRISRNEVTFRNRVRVPVAVTGRRSLDIHRSSMYPALMKLTKDLVAASAVPLILSILGEGESYGYAIIQKVRELSGGEIEWTDGMLYPVLHRLEEQGCVRSRWGQSESGRRRKYYALSGAGRRVLADQKEQWSVVRATLSRLWGPEHA